MDAPGHGAVKIDEKWFAEWFEHGYQELGEYLARHAAFDAWCSEHDQKEPA